MDSELPLPGDVVSCGLQTDLPRKQRIHHWTPLGLDVKNKGIEGICEVEVSACTRCGKDKR